MLISSTKEGKENNSLETLSPRGTMGMYSVGGQDFPIRWKETGKGWVPSPGDVALSHHPQEPKY